MTPEMVLCTRCGFDVRLGRRRRPEDGQPAAREIQRRRVAAEPRVPRAMVFFIVQLIAFAGLFVAGLVRGEWVLMATVVTVHWLLVYIWLMIGAVRDDDLGWAVAAAAILVFPPIVPIVYYYALLISDRSFLKGALGSNAIAMVLLAVLYLKLEGI